MEELEQEEASGGWITGHRCLAMNGSSQCYRMSLAVATRKVGEAVGFFLVLVRRHQGEVDHEDSLGSLRLTCLLPLPLRVPSGLHYTHRHTAGIPFVMVVIAIGVASTRSRHLEYIEHPNDVFNAFDDVWERIASAE